MIRTPLLESNWSPLLGLQRRGGPQTWNGRKTEDPSVARNTEISALNSLELSTPYKTRQTRQIALNPLIPLIDSMSGSPDFPANNPTFG
jgi:hypothetical protein